MSVPVMSDASRQVIPVYPFSALHGQTRLQLALLLVAVDPRIGGVLIEGARGTAKTTSARALADILPEGDFVNLPLGASEEQLVGSLDLELVLQQGKTAFRPGLLARAHRGVLYVDEINLLADPLVDLLLDVCGSGINRIERDGLSHQHAADVVLVGTMNPEEGELRPQLLDRFGLFVSVDQSMDLALRQNIVRSRLAYDEDPEAFVHAHAGQQGALVAQLTEARQRLSDIRFDDEHHDLVSRLCLEAAVDGVRADLVMLRASRAMAALQGRSVIVASDIESVAELVLAHRRQTPAAAEGRSSGPATKEPGQSDTRPSPDSTDSEREEAAESLFAGDKASTDTGAPSTGSSTNEGTQSPLSPTEPAADAGAEDSRAQQTSGGSSDGSPGSSTASDAQWGAMPAQAPEAMPVLSVKATRGIELKKP